MPGARSGMAFRGLTGEMSGPLPAPGGGCPHLTLNLAPGGLPRFSSLRPQLGPAVGPARSRSFAVPGGLTVQSPLRAVLSKPATQAETSGPTRSSTRPGTPRRALYVPLRWGLLCRRSTGRLRLARRLAASGRKSATRARCLNEMGGSFLAPAVRARAGHGGAPGCPQARAIHYDGALCPKVGGGVASRGRSARRRRWTRSRTRRGPRADGRRTRGRPRGRRPPRR